MKISLLTPTGDRPEALTLCSWWVISFMGKVAHEEDSVEWVIVDDGKNASFDRNMRPSYMKYVRKDHEQKDTQRSNLLEGLEHCSGDIIVIIEDDDFYHSGYLKRLVGDFKDGCDVWGEARAIYYNVSTRAWRALGNHTYSTLAQTAFHRSFIPHFKYLLTTGRNTVETVDKQLWNFIRMNKVNAKLYPFSQNVVGIKGMPGRPGIGVGHRKTGPWIKDDDDLTRLKQLVGEAYTYYQPFIKRMAA